MKNIKLNKKNINIYIKILFIFANVSVLLYLYFFLKENAYEAIIPDREYIIAESQQSTGDVNTTKLGIVINNFEKKSKKRPKESVKKDPFSSK